MMRRWERGHPARMLRCQAALSLTRSAIIPNNDELS